MEKERNSVHAGKTHSNSFIFLFCLNEDCFGLEVLFSIQLKLNFYFNSISSDMVKISMDTFVKRFQPDKYEDWVNGTDIGPHPEDPVTEAAAAPIPSDQDILVNKK